MGRALFYDTLLTFRWMSEEEGVSLLQAFARERVIVSGGVKVKASRDPEDDKFLAAAVEGRAAYVVTADRDRLDLERDTDVKIRRPAEFLRILGRTR